MQAHARNAELVGPRSHQFQAFSNETLRRKTSRTEKREIQLPNLDSNTTAFQSPPNARGRDSGGRWDKEEGETVSRAEVAGAHRGSRGCRRAGSVPRDAGGSGDEEREPGRRLLYLLLFLLFATTMARLRGV